MGAIENVFHLQRHLWITIHELRLHSLRRIEVKLLAVIGVMHRQEIWTAFAGAA